MTSMIERVAAMLHGKYWDTLPRYRQESSNAWRDARATLAIIREPTPKMLWAAIRGMEELGDSEAHSLPLEEIYRVMWQAMTDAALEEDSGA